MAPKVSVIIPVYNVEKYLKQTLDCVVNQSLKDIEIICVDNKSTDSTLDIIDSYAQNDDRFVIIKNRENLKQGIARNIGVEESNGEYIFFIDGDDFMNIDCIEKLYDKAKKDDSDITICCWAPYDDVSKKINYKHVYSQLKQIPEEYNNRSFSWRDIKYSIFWQSSVPWDKIYKKSFLIEKDVKFPGGVFFEDNVFVYDAFFKSTKISILRETLIYYRTNRKGAVTNTKDKTFFDYLKIFNLIGDNLKKIDLYDEMKYLYYDYKIITLMWWFGKIKLWYKKEFYEKIRADFSQIEFKEEEKQFLRNKTLFLLDRIKNNTFFVYYPLSFIDKIYRVEKGPKQSTRIILSTFEKWYDTKN